jgi:hypothetical protein
MLARVASGAHKKTLLNPACRAASVFMISCRWVRPPPALIFDASIISSKR